MDFTVRQRAALRALAIIVGILTMMHVLTPHTACAAELDRIAVTVEGHGPDVVLIPGLASSAHPESLDREVQAFLKTERTDWWGQAF